MLPLPLWLFFWLVGQAKIVELLLVPCYVIQTLLLVRGEILAHARHGSTRRDERRAREQRCGDDARLGQKRLARRLQAYLRGSQRVPQRVLRGRLGGFQRVPQRVLRGRLEGFQRVPQRVERGSSAP